MGSVVFSVDAELAWGFHDLDQPLRRRLKVRERQGRIGWRRLLHLFDEHGVPATWAVVGHLFLEACDGRHEDHPAPADWFDRDPGGTELDQPDWFAPSLVESIRDTGVDHEIASHSFSHVVFGADGTTRELAAAEARRSVEVAERLDLELDSFCFPRNRVGYRDVLVEHGFTGYRGAAPPRWFDRAPARPAGKFASYAVGAPPPLVQPTADEFGLVNLPASLHLFSFEGPARTLTEPVIGDVVVRQVKRGLDRVAGTDAVFHLWLHPNDLVRRRDVERVDAVLSAVAARRDRGDVEVETMRRVSEPVRRARPTP